MRCQKINYDTRKKAIRSGEKIMLRKINHTIGLKSYFCLECKKWHLTSKTDKPGVM